jgi:minor extracellular serine protease Vpr
MMHIPLLFAALLLIAGTVSSGQGAAPRCTGEFDVFNNPPVAPKDQLAKARAAPRQGKIIRILSLVDPARFSETELAAYGWRVISRRGEIATLSGNEASAPYLTAIKGIRWVQRYDDHSTSGVCLDTARKMMAVNRVNGIDRPVALGITQSFRGKNVLVGIIDIEFDTHHPAFLDAQKKTRFIALWDQDTNVSKRVDGNYGKIKKGADLDNDSTFGLIVSPGHGTGMASFAVGSDTSLPYFSIAPEAMIIGVKYNHNYVEQDVVNGLFWISDIADSLHVPCVVSLSIGLSSGPHDGTSLTDKAIDQFSSTAGHIVVGAIGNDGDRRTHISFQLANGESKGTWMVPGIDSLKNPPRAKSYSGADVWGEAGKTISVGLHVLDDRTNTYKTSGIALTTQQTRFCRDTVIWQDSLTQATDSLFFVADIERSSALNRKPHVTLALLSTNSHYSMGIQVSLLNNATGVVHAWNIQKLAFQSKGISDFYDGDSASTLNEIGGTAKSILSVGSYINKSKVITYRDSVFDKKTENDIGNRTSFSGTGPTIDGRVKPDICAPGDMVIGAMSRRDPFNWQTSVWPDTNSTNGRYVRATGTSVSSPLVAGVVALLLEASPKLTVDSVKSILSATAIKDNFTGALPQADNRWGAGKVNAYGAIAKLLGINATGKNAFVEKSSALALRITVLSTARKRFLAIHGKPQGSDKPVKVSIFDGFGRRLLAMETRQDRILLPQTLSKGIFFADILFCGTSARSKLVIW